MEIFVDPAVLLEGTVEESFYTQHMREPRPLKDWRNLDDCLLLSWQCPHQRLQLLVCRLEDDYEVSSLKSVPHYYLHLRKEEGNSQEKNLLEQTAGYRAGVARRKVVMFINLVKAPTLFWNTDAMVDRIVTSDGMVGRMVGCYWQLLTNNISYHVSAIVGHLIGLFCRVITVYRKTSPHIE